LEVRLRIIDIILVWGGEWVKADFQTDKGAICMFAEDLQDKVVTIGRRN